MADPYVWNGGSVDGGNTDTTNGALNNWMNPDNWLVDGSVPAAPPGPLDDVIITMNQDIVEIVNGDEVIQPRLVIPTGATARHVDFASGMGHGGSPGQAERRNRITGDATFETLRVRNSSNNAGSNWFSVEQSATLTLIGGTDEILTLHPNDSGSFNQFSGDGIVDVATDAPFVNMGSKNAVGLLRFSHPTAVIDATGNHIGFHGTLEFRPTQTIENLPAVINRGGGALTSHDGSDLNNFGEVELHYQAVSGTGTFQGGTYRALLLQAGGAGHQNPTWRAEGNIVLQGSLESEQAVLVNRTSTVGRHTLNMNGHDLIVNSNAAVELSAVGAAARLDLTSSMAMLGGDLLLASGGELIGDGSTQISISGNFSNQSEQNTFFNLLTSTVTMAGSGNESNPQLFEVQGLDDGPGGSGVDNFGIGHLVIGNSDTWVQFVDEADFSGSGPDALYLGALTVHTGSTLDLNDLNVYVDGTQVFPGDGDLYGGGTIIPEPAALGLLGLSGLLMLRRLRRS